jgi:hypothetical protein
MQKDKKLDELLKQHAIEETSADFTAGVMDKISAMQTLKHNTASILQTGPAKILLVVFAFVCIVLLVLSVTMHPFIPSIKINVLPSSYTTQLIYFIISFWIVMLANLWWKKRNNLIISEV